MGYAILAWHKWAKSARIIGLERRKPRYRGFLIVNAFNVYVYWRGCHVAGSGQCRPV